MIILCLGFSNIVQRRVLPAIEGLETVTGVELASRRGEPDRALLTGKVGHCYGDLATALEHSRAELVYVSTVNSEHTEWVERALLQGRHVIVDKPSFTHLADGERLVELAEKRQLCLAESTVWAAHPQIDLIKEIFAETGEAATRISATFSMPPLPPGNFRYRAELGGGALFDLGPYAVSLGRVFFASAPVAVYCTTNSCGGRDGVETAFSLLTCYPGGRSLVGHFGFDTEYRNQATLLGPGASVSVSRIFTTPPEQRNPLRVQIGNRETVRHAVAADSFACFLAAVVRRLEAADGAPELATDLLDDLRALAALRQAAEEA